MIFNFKTSFSNIELLGFHKARSGANELHNFHILKPSKWPLLVNFILFSLVLSFVIYINCESYSCESVHVIETNINTIQNTNTNAETDNNNYYYLSIALCIGVVTGIVYFIYTSELPLVSVPIVEVSSDISTVSTSIPTYLETFSSGLSRVFSSPQEELTFLYTYISAHIFPDPEISATVIYETLTAINAQNSTISNTTVNTLYLEFLNIVDVNAILTILEIFALKVCGGLEPSPVCGASLFYFLNFSIKVFKESELVHLGDSLEHLVKNLINIALVLATDDPRGLNALINQGFRLNDETYTLLRQGSIEFLSVLHDGTVYLESHTAGPIVIDMAEGINKYRYDIFTLAFNKFITLLFVSFR